MKTEKKVAPKDEKKTSNTKGSGVAKLDAIIKPATGSAKARAGRGMANEGTNVVYDEQR